MFIAWTILITTALTGIVLGCIEATVGWRIIIISLTTSLVIAMILVPKPVIKGQIIIFLIFWAAVASFIGRRKIIFQGCGAI